MYRQHRAERIFMGFIYYISPTHSITVSIHPMSLAVCPKQKSSITLNIFILLSVPLLTFFLFHDTMKHKKNNACLVTSTILKIWKNHFYLYKTHFSFIHGKFCRFFLFFWTTRHNNLTKENEVKKIILTTYFRPSHLDILQFYTPSVCCAKICRVEKVYQKSGYVCKGCVINT